MEKLTGYIKKYFFIAVAIILLGCGKSGSGYVQPQYTYTTYPGTYGTDYYTGCVLVIVSPLSGYVESFQVTLSGAGSYTLPYGSNQIQFNFLYPGSYAFTLYVSSGQVISGYVNVYAGTTTQLNLYPN